MPEVDGLVSVIIPAFNSSAYIIETIESVIKQTYSRLEIIVVNDGSTDCTHEIIMASYSAELKIIYQKNSGVSSARNTGLLNSNGEFLLFLDSDDILSPSFIEERVDALTKSKILGYVGGIVETFPGEKQKMLAVASDPVNQILFFQHGFATIPSNYIIRKNILVQNSILFNTKLNSTADRFFILSLAQHCNGGLIFNHSSKLLYRKSNQSMSNKLSPALMLDNEIFYFEVMKNGFVPSDKKDHFSSTYFFSLGLGFLKIRYFYVGVKYIVKSFCISPTIFFILLNSKLSNRKPFLYYT
jgi:glycosyltransferase involved in cell wall biosynthesis